MQKKTRKALKEESKEEVHPQLDDVSRALLTHMEETGRSSKEDLLKVDAVTEESASFINKMLKFGLHQPRQILRAADRRLKPAV